MLDLNRVWSIFHDVLEDVGINLEVLQMQTGRTCDDVLLDGEAHHPY